MSAAPELRPRNLKGPTSMASSVPRPQVWAVYVLAALLGTATYTVLAQSQPAPARPAAPGVAAQTDDPARIGSAAVARAVSGKREGAAFVGGGGSAPLTSALARRGIQLIHVSTAADALRPRKLRYYDALMVFGDQTFTARAAEGAGRVRRRRQRRARDPQSGARRPGRVGVSGCAAARVCRHRGDRPGGHPIMKDVQPFATADEGPAPAPPAGAETTVLMQRTLGQGRKRSPG